MIFQARLDNNRLKFVWEEAHGMEERIIIRNRLTKIEYYNERCTQFLERNGIPLRDNGIPVKDVPLDVLTRLSDGSEYKVNVPGVGTPYRIEYSLKNYAFSKTYSIKLLCIRMPNLTEDVIQSLPEKLIYFELHSLEKEDIRIYLPRLKAGENLFEVNNLPKDYEINVMLPKLDEGNEEFRPETVFILRSVN